MGEKARRMTLHVVGCTPKMCPAQLQTSEVHFEHQKNTESLLVVWKRFEIL